jgi:hypothetical protein
VELRRSFISEGNDLPLTVLNHTWEPTGRKFEKSLKVEIWGESGLFSCKQRIEDFYNLSEESFFSEKRKAVRGRSDWERF